MRIDIQNYFGGSSEAGKLTSPIQLSLLKLKQYIDVHYQNIQMYDSYDLGPYLMAVADCYNLATEISRDIRLLNTVVLQTPAVYPQQILDLLDICGSQSVPAYPDGERPTPGSAFRDDAEHVFDLTNRFNCIINTLNQLAVPLNMPIFEYNRDLYDRIYLDGEDVHTSQQYIFASTGYWLYEEDEDVSEESVGSRVVYYEWPEYSDGSRWKTLRGMIDTLDRMVQHISSSYTSSMSFLQQITNALGSSQIRTFPKLEDPLAGVSFEYNPSMLISIENLTLADQAWPCAFIADAESDSLLGTPFMVDDPEVTNLPKYCMIDLPLQFHCPADKITQPMLGYALRFHPSFTHRTRAKVYTASAPEGIIRNIITTDGSYGFAICQRLVVGVLDNQSKMTPVIIKHRGIEELTDVTLPFVLNDFNNCPMLISATFHGTPTTQEVYNVLLYTGRRDVEVSLSKDETMAWWTGLTEYAWGTNISNDIRGSRERR